MILPGACPSAHHDVIAPPHLTVPFSSPIQPQVLHMMYCCGSYWRVGAYYGERRMANSRPHGREDGSGRGVPTTGEPFARVGGTGFAGPPEGPGTAGEGN